MSKKVLVQSATPGSAKKILVVLLYYRNGWLWRGHKKSGQGLGAGSRKKRTMPPTKEVPEYE